MKNKRIHLFLLMCIVILGTKVYADVATDTGIVLSNSNATGESFNISSGTVSAGSFDLAFNGSCSPNQGGCTDPFTLIALNNGLVSGAGPNMALADIYQAPAYGGPFTYWNSFPIYQQDDGLFFIGSDQGVDEKYAFLVITAIDPNGANITLDYIYNNETANTTFGPPVGCAADYPNQTACFDAMNQGEPCFWEHSMSVCRDQDDNVEFFDESPGCFIFDTDSEYCETVFGCQWYPGPGICDPNATFPDFHNIQCGNITNSTLCDAIPSLDSCCTWDGSACQRNITTNSCFTSAEPPAGQGFCEDWNVTTEAVCDDLAGLPYFFPCEWDNVTNNCVFRFDNFFEGGPGGFDDINTQQNCEAAGGEWKTEVYIYTDSYGEHTDTHEWCEMAFGFGSESCDTSCWACEFQADGSDWSDTATAQSACQNSSLGLCEFHQDSNAFNGKGWCDFPHEFFFGGAGDCDSDCGSCNFMNEPNVSCTASLAGCNWVNITSSFGYEEWCESDTKTTCVDDCFQCYDEIACGNSPDGCEWDSTFYYCTPENFGSKEICFDGVDNDGDDNIDCEDSDCSFDQFCGGFAFGFTEMCWEYDEEEGGNESLCNSTTTPFGNCTWINNSLTGFEGLCENPGESCFWFEENESVCTGAGCNWKNATGCGINITAENICVQYDGTNQSICEGSNPNCVWDNSTGGEYCDYAAMEVCYSYGGDPTGCNLDGNCTWIQDEFGPGGWCDPICFDNTLNSTECQAIEFCKWQTGFCEGGFMMGGCFELDGNQTACLAEGNGNLCNYHIDPMAGNSVGGGEPDGWCNDKHTGQMFEGQEGGEPIILEADGLDGGVAPEVDMIGLGLKDNPNSYAFGAPVVSTTDAAFCTGENTTKFFLYLDTDGNTTNNCNSSDSNAYDGFEFYFTYKAEFDSDDMESFETKLSYRCFNETWVPTPIPLSFWDKVMCNDIGGPMFGIEKESLRKFQLLYNESQDMRVYIISADDSTNISTPVDTIGPTYYTPGTADFKFECCTCPGQDIDGDGFTSEQDPDCKAFNQFGYIPFEGGPECIDNIDNDGNGYIDCDDPGCTYDPFFCGGAFIANVNDTKTPSMVWLEVDTFDTFAFAKFDTNEPSNGTFTLYNDQTCTQINMTLNDTGLTDDFSGNEFKPWHDVILDNNNLGFDLDLNTTYNYKIKYCDPSGNCGLSACLNFTTETSIESFVFDFDIPTGFVIDIPQLGISDEGFDFGQQTNATVAKDLNVTFKCNETGYELTFVGMSLLGASDFNFTDAFVCGNQTGDELVGMESDNWQDFLLDTGVDYLEVQYPFNATTIEHCDINGSNCQDVNDSVDCTFEFNQTICEIPVATGLGFSSYSVSGTLTGSSGSNNNDDNNDGGSSGGSGGSSGSSGGSAGGVAGKEAKAWDNVEAGQKISFVLTKESVGIDSLGFEMKNNETYFAISIKKLSKKLSSFSDPIEDLEDIAQVVSYFDFTKTSLVDEDHGEVDIKFSINKTWFDTNFVEPEQIVMLRYVDDVWMELETTVLSTSGNKYQFQANSPGFSYFAAAVREKEVIPEPVEEEKGGLSDITGEVVEEIVVEETLTVEEPVEIVDSPEKTGLAFGHIALGIITISGIVGGLVYAQLQLKKKEDEHKDHHDKKGHDSFTDDISSDDTDLKELQNWVNEALVHHQKSTVEKKLKEAGWSHKVIEKVLKKK